MLNIFSINSSNSWNTSTSTLKELLKSTLQTPSDQHWRHKTHLTRSAVENIKKYRGHTEALAYTDKTNTIHIRFQHIFKSFWSWQKNTCSLESHWNYKLYPGLSFEFAEITVLSIVYFVLTTNVGKRYICSFLLFFFLFPLCCPSQ